MSEDLEVLKAKVINSRAEARHAANVYNWALLVESRRELKEHALALIDILDGEAPQDGYFPQPVRDAFQKLMRAGHDLETAAGQLSLS